LVTDPHAEIRGKLTEIEAEDGVVILYACESGSRAWGFESTDSDYDVRFIYVRPTRFYLSIQRPRNVIERPISEGLDASGWDLPKTLELFRKSNPPLLEWLQSPIVYASTTSFAEKLRALLSEYYSPVACIHHYLHMAEGNCREYLNGPEVWTKKYFYVLRPVLACIWLERGLGVVPTELGMLVEAVVTDSALRDAIAQLLEAKKAGEELRKGPRNEVISAFVARELARFAGAKLAPAKTRSTEALDRLFVDTLVDVNGATID